MPKKRYQRVLFLSLLLTLGLVLSACDNNQTTPTVTPVAADIEAPVVDVTTDVEEEGADESEVLTDTGTTGTDDVGAVDSRDVNTDTLSGDVEIVTDTQLITGTEVLTAVEVTTDTVVLEQQLVTTVVTSTDLVTDVPSLTDEEVITETDFMTETEHVSPTTQTEGAVGSANVVQLTATPSPSATPSPMPTATPTVLVEVTEVVTATVQVTEVITETVTDTEVVTDTVEAEVTPTPAISVTGTVTDTSGVAAPDMTLTPSPMGTTITNTETTTETSEARDATVFTGVVDANNRIMRVSELLGANVNDFNQEDVGSMNDLIVNLSNGHVIFATLASGGFLGLGEETYPVPLSAFRYLPDTDEVMVNIDEAQLVDAPGFDSDWPDVTDARYDVEVEQFWRNLGTNVVPDRTVAGVRSVSGTVVKASNLLNSSLFNPEGENLGDIDDLLIDLGSGQVRYVIVAIGGFLGLGEELRAIPLRAFDLDTRGVFDDTAAATFILGVDQAVLEQAPTFNADAYPNTATPDWDAEWLQFWEDNR